MRVATSGPTSGIPLLFMHGWPESWYSWRHQITFFAKQGYRVFAPDMRGYGGTDSPPRSSDFTVYNHASDMIGLLQHYQLTKAILIGHDWGAILGWQLAHLYPEYFPVVANLSVPYRLRTPTSINPFLQMKKAFGKDFFYITYHNETFHNTDDHGPAENEYDSDPHEFLYNVWSDSLVERDASTIKKKVGKYRRDGGMLANMKSKQGRPLTYPTWLSEKDLDYVVEQFKVSGFRGGINYYRNFGTNHEMTPHLINRKLKQPCFFLTGENDVVRQGFGLKQLTQSDKVTSDTTKRIDPQKASLLTVCDDLRTFIVLPKDAKNGKSAGHWIQQERSTEVNEALLLFFQSTEQEFRTAPGGPSMSSSNL